MWGERGRVIRDERSAFWIPTSESSRGWDDGDMGWVDDGSTASGLSPPPVPSTRAPPRAGAQRSGLTAPCAPPHAEAVRTGRHGQTLKTVSPELLLLINVLQSPPYFRADEDSFGRAPRDANWVSPRGGGSHFARRDPRGFDRERRLRAERQARPSGGHKEAESRGTFVRSRHVKQRARGPRARPSQQGVRGRAGVRRGVGTSHTLQRHRLPRLWGGAEAPAQAHAGARCAPPIIDRAP